VVSIQGKLEVALVQQSLEGELARLEKCFLQARDQGGKLPPLVTLKITIGSTGKVIAARVMNAADIPASLAKCLVEAIQQAAFPKPSQGKAEVEIRLTLPALPGA
jgi:hypothetical protein